MERMAARAAATSTRPISAQQLADMACLVASAADDQGIPSDALRETALVLALSEPEARPRAALEIIRAAATVARGAQEAGSRGVEEVANNLGHAAHGFLCALLESPPERMAPRSVALLARAASKARAAATSRRPISAQQLADMACLVASAADDQGIPSGALREAALALARSDAETRPRASMEIIRAAAMVARGAQESGSRGVREVLADLEHACHNFACALYLQSGSSSRINASQDRYDGNILNMLGFSLSSSLNLIPYMTRDTILKGFSYRSCWWINLLVPGWFGAVSLGIPFAFHGTSKFEQQFTLFLAHLGMLGITVLVILYTYWMIATGDVTLVLWLLSVFILSHSVLWILGCIRSFRR